MSDEEKISIEFIKSLMRQIWSELSAAGYDVESGPPTLAPGIELGNVLDVYVEGHKAAQIAYVDDDFISEVDFEIVHRDGLYFTRGFLNYDHDHRSRFVDLSDPNFINIIKGFIDDIDISLDITPACNKAGRREKPHETL
jgi:hypothetical protein